MTWVTDRNALFTMHQLKMFEDGDEVKLKLKGPLNQYAGAGARANVLAYANPRAICRLEHRDHWWRDSVAGYDYIAFYRYSSGIWVSIDDIAAWRRKEKRR